jgi:uncharacterized Zn finger protein|tara:strand:+ start:1142 stop:1390 length:249 start_codon:yes stop_codon:yes gene_type:complete
MNMKAQKPIGKPQQKLDLSKADTLNCQACGNYLFITSTIIKKISAIMSPNGQEGLIPIEVFSCGNCGQVPKEMLKGTGLETP